MNEIYIGTSGWVYKGWAKTFYPENVPQKEWLGFYTTRFRTVEINATFYRLPTLKMTKAWRDRAPDGFVFAVKGSRFLTHIKKLSAVAAGLKRYFSRLRPLEERVGPVLWQLPPFLKKDPPRLEKFLQRLGSSSAVPKTVCHAFEFRHPSWFDGEVYDLLRGYNAALVWVSSLKFATNSVVTADFVYIRFHGLEKGAFHDYSRKELEPWARAMRREARSGKTVYAYFNNDLNVRAPNNARMLMQMVQP